MLVLEIKSFTWDLDTVFYGMFASTFGGTCRRCDRSTSRKGCWVCQYIYFSYCHDPLVLVLVVDFVAAAAAAAALCMKELPYTK